MADFDQEAYDKVCKDTAAEIESLMKRVVSCRRAQTMTEDVQSELNGLGVTDIITYTSIYDSPQNPGVPRSTYIAIEVKLGDIQCMAEHRAENASISPEEIDVWDILGWLEVSGLVSAYSEGEQPDWRDEFITLEVRILDGDKVMWNHGQMRPLSEVLR